MSLGEVILSAAIAGSMSLLVCVGSGIITRCSVRRIFRRAAAEALKELEEENEKKHGE